MEQQTSLLFKEKITVSPALPAHRDMRSHDPQSSWCSHGNSPAPDVSPPVVSSGFPTASATVLLHFPHTINKFCESIYTKIQQRITAMHFSNVYFINGTAYAGKSTMVKLLAKKYNGIVCEEIKRRFL